LTVAVGRQKKPLRFDEMDLSKLLVDMGPASVNSFAPHADFTF